MQKTSAIVTVLGAGAWGIALSNLVRRNQHEVRLWSRQGDLSLAAAIAETNLIISAVSMAGVSPTIDRLKSLNISSKSIILTATKGLDSVTTYTPSQLWQMAYPKHPIVVLSGPNLSKEIQQDLPAVTVVSSKCIAAAEKVQQILSSERFRVYVNPDPIGTELGGTLKNVIAIAAGVCDGLALGTNAKAGLLTRALSEMIRVGKYLGGAGETFFGLSGLGDLLATCNSPLSRNYQVGYRLGKGESLSQILANLEGTAEGINTAEVLMKIAHQQNLTMPIAEQVYGLLQGKTTPEAALHALMERSLKSETIDF